MPSPFRIGLILQGNSQWVGGTEYSKNLLKAVYSLPAKEQASFEFIPLAEGSIEESLYRDMPERFHRHLRTNFFSIRPPRPYWYRLLGRVVPWWIKSPSTAVTAARDCGLDFLYPCLRSPSDPRTVGTASWIPDFQHKYMPNYFSPAELQSRETTFARIAHDSTRVILSSQVAASDFRRYFPESASKARILPFCTVPQESWFSTDIQSVAQQYHLPDRYFIVCNQFWQHKNHRVVFAALQALRQRGIRPDLVCTGNLADYRIPDMKQRVLAMVEEFGVTDQVRLVGLIPRADQIQMIRAALAVIQPSLFEGWSTVVEDARVLGKELLLSDLDVHREQNPPKAVYFNPHDPETLAGHLQEYWASINSGLNLQSEAEARCHHQRDLQKFGRRFLAIAQE